MAPEGTVLIKPLNLQVSTPLLAVVLCLGSS
jgi:hypothetical protein